MWFIFLLLFYTSCQALELINIPTTDTLPKGDAALAFRIYDEGGLVIDSRFGLTKRVVVGIPLDLQNAIGDEKMETSLPLVLSGRIRVTDGTKRFPSLAIGYHDPYGYKKIWLSKRIKGMKGLYLVASKPILLLDTKIGSHFGLLADVEDYVKGGLSLFCGAEADIGSGMKFSLEVGDIPLDKGEEKRQAALSLGMKWNLAPKLSLEFDLIDLSRSSSRIVKICYQATLFKSEK
ncbi:hypothetical protein KKG61_06490 [bacterium]|nr:hypothetical protein [bacterium]MBU1599733.1 hypothetical protein [bacterium]MBU2461543.1 hypothetical protein [bacterium]